MTAASELDSAVQKTLQARVDDLESQLAVTREQLADTAKDRDEWRDIAKEATSNVKLITNQGGGAKSNDNLMAFAAVAFVVGIGLAYMMLRNDVTPSDNQPEPVVSEGMDSLEQLMWEAGIKPSAPEEYDEFIPPPAQVPRTVCSIYDINRFSKYNDAECGIGYINTKLEDRIRLQNKFPDAEHMRITPAEELASRCLNDGLTGEVDEWIAAKCPEAILELADMYQVELHPNELSGKPK